MSFCICFQEILLILFDFFIQKVYVKSFPKLVGIKESLDICDISGIRKPKCRNFTFRQNHLTGIIERRWDYIFISNCLQEFVNYTDVLPDL